MATWIRNISETWANNRGWRTDIPLTHLRFGYETAEYILEDDTRIRIPMSELRRVLATANVRNNFMVGPFNVNPHDQLVNDVAVSMEIVHPARH